MSYFKSLKQNSITYRSSKVQIAFFKFTSCDNQILVGWIPFPAVAVHFNPEIIKIGQSSYKMCNNNILNFQASTTILNACTKKVFKLIEGTTYILRFILDVSVVCERLVETKSDCDIDPTFLLTIAGLRPHLGLWLLNRGLLRATALSLQAGPHSDLPVSKQLNCRRHLPMFFHNAHLIPLLPLIYTGASLIDGSVKGQYIASRLVSYNRTLEIYTSIYWAFFSISHKRLMLKTANYILSTGLHR